MADGFPTGIVTLVFTDIEGSSELWEQHRDAFRPVLEAHNVLMRETARQWKGVEVKTEGDAFFLAFSSSSKAVQFAADAQLAFARHPWDSVLPGLAEVRVRIGMHTGEPIVGDGHSGGVDYFGPHVNRAARVSSAGYGAQVLVSNASRESAAPELPPAISFLDLSVHRLKGVGEERIWQVCHPDLRREFPPIKTLNPERHNLPLPPTPYVGREKEIAQWCELLQQPTTRLLTLLAFGGMGKTRSALQIGELCADSFPDGVWWIELEEAHTGEEAIQRIANQLRIYLRPQAPVKDQLKEFLRGKDTLLLLDNTEQIPDAGDMVNGLLNAAPKLKALVTSRKALGLQVEKIVDVSPLPLLDSESLFIERARARKSDFEVTPDNAGDVLKLCRRLEGVPLAIELAASRIRLMSPREILGKLDETFGVLQTRAPDLPPRQRALRGAIDWSYDLLSEEDKNLFAQLAVFVGGFLLHDAEAVCEAPDVAWSVEELLAHSLLRCDTDLATQQTRYSMLASVQEYASEKLRGMEKTEKEVRDRHALRFLRFAQEELRKFRSKDEVAALSLFEKNYDNVRVAREWAASKGDVALAAEMALVMGTFLQRRGFLNEATGLIQSGLQALQSSTGDNQRLYAMLLRECAGLRLDMFEWTESRRSASEALTLLEGLADEKELADAYNLVGLACNGERNYAEARMYMIQALEKFQNANDRIGVANVLNNLGLIEYDDADGDKQETMHYWQESLLHRREVGDQRGIAESLNNLGVISMDQGRPDEAWKYYEEALQCEKELRHVLGVARSLFNLAEIAEKRDHPESAFRMYAGAMSLFDRIGSPYAGQTLDLLTRMVADAHRAANLDELTKGLKEKSLEELTTWATSPQLRVAQQKPDTTSTNGAP